MKGWTAAAAVVLGAALARATVLVPMTDEDLVGSSDIVVIGVVAGIETALLPGPRLVTRVTLAVERVLKGDVPGETLVVTEPGGRVAGLLTVVEGSPEWTRDERALVFLRVRADGTLGTTALALGKYTLAAAARRAVPVPDVRPAAAFERRVAALAAGQPGAATDGRHGAAVVAPLAVAIHDAFTVKTVNGLPVRWFEPDCGLPLTYSRANAEAGFDASDSEAAVTAGLAAWTGVSGAPVTLVQGADSQPARSVLSGTTDGVNNIQFDDPFGEVTDFVGCSGVLALGGFTASDSAAFGYQKTVNGTAFARIIEGDVSVNPGLATCHIDAAGLAELVGHEVGHTLGFGHSSENPSEADPTLRDALMFFQIHNDDRGAVLGTDDVAAMQASYPASAVAPADAVATLACEVGLGFVGYACFGGVSLPSKPFALQKKAVAALQKAAVATVRGKRRKLVKQARALLAMAQKKVKPVPGACGDQMRAKLAGLVAQAKTVFAVL